MSAKVASCSSVHSVAYGWGKVQTVTLVGSPSPPQQGRPGTNRALYES